MEEIKKSYYAIIPADVRYDTNLSANAKLLYGEITALCNEKGYCWATNDYFAKLYNVSKKSISRWIRELRENNYIDVEIIYREGSKEIVNRYIKICTNPIDKNVNTPMDENVTDNNTYINNTINNTYNNNIKEKNIKKENGLDEIIDEQTENENLKQTIYEFIKMRKAIKKPLTIRGLELMINKLKKLTEDTDEQIEILNQSIMNNWQGIFALNEQAKKEFLKEHKQEPKLYKSYDFSKLSPEDYGRLMKKQVTAEQLEQEGKLTAEYI